MPDFTEEEYLGAIFKLKILARNKTPISSTRYAVFNLGICSIDLLAEDKKRRTRSQLCPLDLDRRIYACVSSCAHFEHNYSVEQIYKLIEDFEVKE